MRRARTELGLRAAEPTAQLHQVGPRRAYGGEHALEPRLGGVYITPKTREEDKYQGKVGLVLALGPESYADEERFPDGPWCQVGDWVMWKDMLTGKIRF